MANGDTGKMFEPLTINGVTFSNRLLRSSVGGRTAGYDGTVTDVWKNFEKRFADGGVGGIISTTFNVNRHRKTPLEYPPISEDKYVAPLARFITEIKSKNTCKYLIQIGDPGHATQTGLFPEKEDSHSSSWGFDLLYGYNNTRTRMSGEEIQSAIDDFANAAKRVQDAGADGIELTAAKGYLIHQFLNPGFNRRKDEWGGSADKRFRLLKLITEAVREKVGKDFLFGIRLAAADYNYLPLQSFIFRCPWVFPLKHHFMGNSLEQMLEYARDLKEIPVDFLHVVSGFGFPSPRVTPGKFPLAEAKMVLNATRHLSLKACVRSTVLNATPEFIASPLANIGWRRHQGINLDFAARFKQEIGLPIIANGGFQDREFIEGALVDEKCDMVSMARALIARPDLVKEFEQGGSGSELGKPCTYCNRCAARTVTSPLGCYDPGRFDDSMEIMRAQIMDWNRHDDAKDTECVSPIEAE